jgi:hypothetical protein
MRLLHPNKRLAIYWLFIGFKRFFFYWRKKLPHDSLGMGSGLISTRNDQGEAVLI